MPARRRHTSLDPNYSLKENQPPPGVWNFSNNLNPVLYSETSSVLTEIEENMTTSRDRTNEFSNAVQVLLSRNVSRIVSLKDTRKAKCIQSHSEFMRTVKIVGKNIANTFTKLEKLTLLAKQNSLFNDRTQEIQELTYIIKNDLNSLNEQIGQLQNISKLTQQKTGKHLRSHNNSVLLALQSKLATMSTDFKQILEVRGEHLKQQKSRRDKFTQPQTGAVNTLPPSVMSGSVLLQDGQVNIELDSPSYDNRLIPKQGGQQMQQMLIQDETDQYLQSRAETMQNIESTIVELGGIFQQLATMVKEQEEMVERIDTNIQDAELNIEAAHTQILKYFRSVTSNRWLMVKVFAVLIFFFIFFVVFLT